ncbi:MAG: Fic family protein [Actinomycetota bacterium]|nr:Fic family protein [Actinomycetota bacterium]MDQ3630557.1 Fic family protein [Actinomycetota bacterium]
MDCNERIALPEIVECVWEGGGYGARRDRKPFRFHAFVPDPIGDWDEPLAGRAADAVARATGALGELQAAGAGHDLEALAGPILRAEALGSSFIEGLRASNRRLALAAYEPLAADGTARAVLGNVRAVERAIAIGTESRRFRLTDLLDIHRVLLEGTTEERHAGVVRTDQSWIGGRGTSPADASFVPPPPDRVPALLDDLVRFVGLDDLPAVAQAAIAHAQFETIHPFGDGNGRAGRCLIHVILRRRRLTPLFVPPVSVVLATRARRYIYGLVDFREGRIDDWIGLFADSVTTAAEATKRLWGQIDALLAQLLERAGSPRADSVARRIVLGLPAQPVVSADTAAARYGVTPTAARGALNRLQETGVLVPTRVGRRRDREWISDELFQLLDAFEHNLGQPAEGETARPAPSPTRPSR